MALGRLSSHVQPRFSPRCFYNHGPAPQGGPVAPSLYLVLHGARKWRPHRLCVKMFECEFKLLDQRSTFDDDLSIYSTFLLVNFSIAGHMVGMWLNSRDFVVKAQVMHSWHSKVRPVSPRISSMYSKNTLPIISNRPYIAKTIMGTP